MEFNQILELIDHVSASELTAFTYETADLTLSMEHGKPQIIQGVIGETVENIPAVGMTGGKVRRAVNTAPVAGKDPVVPASTDEMAVTVTGKTVAEAQGVKGTEQSETVPQSEEDQTGSLGNISVGRNLLCCTVPGSSALRSGGRQGKKRPGSCNRGSDEADE